MIYLDNNSTTLLDEEICLKIHKILKLPLNPSSIHRLGQRAKAILEDSRLRIKNSLKAYCHDIIFTSSGTESCNMAIKGLDFSHVFTPATEHEAVLNTVKSLPNHTILNTDRNGQVGINELENLIKPFKNTPFLVSIMLANNETGIICENFHEITALVHEYEGYIHTDATQWVGKEYFDFSTFSPDFVSFAAHKIHGPLGAACLIVSSKIDIKPMLYGGGQEGFKRPSTHNLPAIYGLGLALEKVNEPLYIQNFKSHTAKLQTLLEAELEAKGAVIFGKHAKRLTNTTFFAIPKIENKTIIIKCDLAGIYVSNGSACSSGSSKPSHVLTALGYSSETTSGAIRVSTSICNTTSDIASLTSISL